MSAKKIKDLVVSVGKYESNGKTKNRYVNVGMVLQKDDGGEFILINRYFNPAGVPNPDGKDTILVSSFDVKDGQEAGNHKGYTPTGNVAGTADDLDSPIPF